MNEITPELHSTILSCTKERDAEFLCYSGPIEDTEVNKFIAFALNQRKDNQRNISLMLTTYGGEANPAYRLARFLQSWYEHIRLYIVGPCKSAGTLVTLCADELVFGPFGEIGPLDIQIAKKDDLFMAMGSGLDTFQALTIIRNYAQQTFLQYMYGIVENSGGAISTTTAADLAAKLVAGLFQPLMSQLDPQRMGEVQRLIDIAKRYGERLNRKNLKDDTLKRLVEDYPAHTFVIDYSEACQLFKSVEKISRQETSMVLALQQAGACILQPSRGIKLFDVSTLLPEGSENGNETGKRIAQDTREDDPGQQRAGRSAPRRKRGGTKTTRNPRPTNPRPTNGTDGSPKM